jgi:hypothetical protein
MRFVRKSMKQSATRSDSLAQHLGLFALLVALWAMNLFPIQQAQTVLVASAIVSSQRLSSLQELSRQKQVPSESIQWVHYQRDARGKSRSIQSASQDSSIEHMRLMMGVRTGDSTEQIQRELERLTESETETASSTADQTELRSQRWRLATIEHQMMLFELDQTRQMQQADVATTEMAATEDQATGEYRTRIPASTVVHRKLSAEPAQDHRKTWETLLSDFDRCATKIEQLERQIKEAKTKASGTIALTGSPRIGVLSSRASISHVACVLAFTVLSCIALVLFLQPPNRRKNSRTPKVDQTDFSKLLTELGLRNLGTIHITGLESTSEPPPAMLSSKTESRRQFRRLEFSCRIVNALLVAWVGLFAIRFLSDSNWRELLFNAPLSAFSSMISGI